MSSGRRSWIANQGKTTMRAVVYEKSATTGHFSCRDVERPDAGSDDVLIRVHTTALNAGDYRLFKHGLGVPESGIFGTDVAGTVASVGGNVTAFKPGDEVAADVSSHGSGGMAEYVRVPQHVVARKPPGVSFEDAAASPVAAVTALQALRDAGRIRPGQNVLIQGASGGVGTFAVQLAKYYGADVTAVCSTGNVQRMRDLGADSVIDYAAEDFTRSGVRYDLIVAVNGYHPLLAYMRCLATTGTLVMVGGTLGQVMRSLVAGPLISLGRRKVRTLVARPNAEDLALVMELLQEGRLHPMIDRTFSFSEGGAAFLYAAAGHAAGKVLIRVASEA